MKIKYGLLSVAALTLGFSAQAQTLSGGERSFLDETARLAIRPGDIVRIQEDIANRIRWSGVRGCGDRARARREFDAAFNRWIGEQVRRHNGQRVVRQGWGQLRYGSRSSRGPWPDRRRNCGGSFVSAPVFIEFRR